MPRVSRVVRRIAVVLGALLSTAGCVSESPPPAAPMTPASSTAPRREAEAPPPPPAKEPWCARVPDLTEDASGDRTGQANDLARVKGVQSRIQWELFACGGIAGVGITTAEIAEALLHHAPFPRPSRPVTEQDLTYVLRVMIADAKRMPPANPLYVDGVRVYFEVTGPIEPL